MDKNAFDQLKSALKSKTVEKDEIIYKEGEPAGDGYILSLGEVLLLQKNSSGGEVQKQKINSMQVFGIWNSIFESEFRLFTAKATEKSSLLVIPTCTYRPASPMCSLTFVKKAITGSGAAEKKQINLTIYLQQETRSQ